MHNLFSSFFSLDAAFLPLYLISTTEKWWGKYHVLQGSGKTLRLANLGDRCHIQAAPIIHVDALKAPLSRPAAVSERNPL